MNGVGRGDENQKKEKLSVLTKETLGMTLLLFSAIIFFIAITGPYVFGDIGLAISAFFVGLFGFFTYPLLLLTMYGSFVMVFGKKPLSARLVLRVLFLIVCVFFIVHTATAERFFGGTYGSYLSGCWSAATERIASGTGGGLLFGLIAYPVRLLLSAPGAYILFSLLTLLSVYLLLLMTPLKAVLKPSARVERPARGERSPKGKKADAQSGRAVAFGDLETPLHTPMPATNGQKPSADVPAPEPADPFDPYRSSREILFRNDPAANYRSNLIYDRDSAFNRGARRSSVEPGAQTPPPAAPVYNSYSAPTPSYMRSYSERAETDREPMPRRVTSSETDGGTYEPPAPSFRAPSEPAHGRRDCYVNDVESEFSSAPNVFDEPVPTDPRPTMPETSEPRREFLDPFGSRGKAEPSPEDRFTRTDVSSDDRFTRTDVPSEDRFTRTDVSSEDRFTRTDMPSDDRFTRTDMPSEDRFTRADVSSDDRFTRTDMPSEDRFTRTDMPSEDRFTRTDVSSDDRFTRTDVPPVAPSEPAPADRFGERRSLRFGFGDKDELPPRSFDEPRFSAPQPDRPETEERAVGRDSASGLFDDNDENELVKLIPDPEKPAPEGPTVLSRGERGLRRTIRDPEPPPAPAPRKKKHVWKRYKRPSLDLLDTYEERPPLSNEESGRNSGIILDTLRRFRIETKIIGIKPGASVTRYDLAMPESGTINMITRYADELALYLMVKKGINMYANPQVRGISIEVPNDKRYKVGLRSILQSEEFRKDDPEAITFALGQDIEGECVCGNITEMTHILVAGTTGSGKSITMHAMLISLLYKYSPEELRLILIDPKQSEFTIYEGLPHLMINEIITQAPKVVTALNWAIKEMERRYTLFNEKTRSGVAVSKLDEYNATLTEDEERLPKILIVVDEFGELMLIAKKEIEERIQRLAQKARAAGIHLVLATQRPSADVITGVIKSNLPTRIALSVDSDLNSRIMLDESGAENLLGYGDMLIKQNGKPRRAQGAFISPAERQRVVSFIRENNEAYFDEEVSDYIDKTGAPAEGGGSGSAEMGDGSVPDTYIRALAIVVKLGQASISLIQRKCSVGYNHAGKIIEWMESMEYISPFDGKAKARTVLLTPEEFESIYGDIDR